jgi:hypothetical protein
MGRDLSVGAKGETGWASLAGSGLIDKRRPVSQGARANPRDKFDEDGIAGWGAGNATRRGNLDTAEAYGRDRRDANTLAHHEDLFGRRG